MNWVAVVPIKPFGVGKARLRTVLSARQRGDLAAMLLDRLSAAIGSEGRIDAMHLLAAASVPSWPGGWIRDDKRGLNAELTAACEALARPAVLVIHPDLPMVTNDDISALLDAAERAGSAIAPDRHDVGTNALAWRQDATPAFAFGERSFAAHCATMGRPAVVRRPGLGTDIDTPDDLVAACASCPALQRFCN